MMGLYPKVEVKVLIEDEEVLHLGALNDEGIAMSLCPGDDDMPLVRSALAEAMLMTTGMRPGPLPNISVMDGRGMPLPRKKPKLSLVPEEPKS